MGFCSNLGVRRLFSSPFVSYWAHIDWLAPGYLMGAGNPTISRETETQVWAAPHRGTKVTTQKETLRIKTQRVPIKKKKKERKKGQG